MNGRDGALADGELWTRAAAGSSEAFGALFDRHGKAVYRHCYRLSGSWAMAEDMVQNTFLTAWRKRHLLDVESHASVLPWLLTVATNIVHTEHRSQARRLRLARRAPVDPPTEDPADEVVARIDGRRRVLELVGEIRLLPRNQREALALCVWADLTYAEAAAALGIKEVSVRARVSRARATLTGGSASATDRPRTAC